MSRGRRRQESFTPVSDKKKKLRESVMGTELSDRTEQELLSQINAVRDKDPNVRNLFGSDGIGASIDRRLGILAGIERNIRGISSGDEDNRLFRRENLRIRTELLRDRPGRSGLFLR